jgi:hypothetical protein
MSYAQRKHKHYKHRFVNAHQTPEQRRDKYAKLRNMDIPPSIARKLRDFRNFRKIANQIKQLKPEICKKNGYWWQHQRIYNWIHLYRKVATAMQLSLESVNPKFTLTPKESFDTEDSK